MFALLIWGNITKQADHRQIHQQTMSVWANRFQMNHTSNAVKMVWEYKDSFGRERRYKWEVRRSTNQRDLRLQGTSIERCDRTNEEEREKERKRKHQVYRHLNADFKAVLDARSQFPSLSPWIAFNKSADRQIRQKITANSNKSNIHFTPPL